MQLVCFRLTDVSKYNTLTLTLACVSSEYLLDETLFVTKQQLPIEPKPSYPECTPSDVGDEQWLSCSTSLLIQNNPARHKNMFSVRSLSHLERLWVMHCNTWDLEKMMHRCRECMTAFPPASNAGMVSSFLSLLLTKWRTTTNGGDLLSSTPYDAKVYQSDLFLNTRLWQQASFSLDKAHLLTCDSPVMVFTHSFFQSFVDSYCRCILSAPDDVDFLPWFLWCVWCQYYRKNTVTMWVFYIEVSHVC